MDIKITISMFEDLKRLILKQFSNLSKLVESLANANLIYLCYRLYHNKWICQS